MAAKPGSGKEPGAKSVDERRLAEAELARISRALNTISRCNQAMIRAKDEFVLLEDICDILVSVGGYRMAWIGYARDDCDKPMESVAIAGMEGGSVDKAMVSWVDSERGQGPLSTAIRTRKYCVVNDVLTDASFIAGRNEAVRIGYASVISLPLITDDQAFGVLTIYSEKRDFFNTDEIVLLQELTDNLAYGITALRSRIGKEQAERKLRESEVMFRVLAETTKAGISLYRGDKCIYANPALEKMSGYTNAELLSMVIWDVVHPDYRELVKKRAMDRQRGLSVPECYEFPFVTKSGETRWVEVTGGLILYRDEPTRIGTFFDITERKQAEQVLQKSEEKFRALAETTKIGIFLFKGDQSIYINPAMEKITGYTNAELLSMYIWDYIHLDYREVVRNLSIDRQCGLSVPTNYEIAIITKGGETRWVEVSIGLILYQGKLTGLSTFFDITERKRAEKALVREKYILTKSQEIAHLGNWAFDVEAGKFAGSGEIDRIHGYEPGDARPTREWVLSRVHPDNCMVVADFLDVSIRDGKRGSISYRVIRPDGSVRHVNAIVDRAVMDKAGKVTWLYGITQDITEWKRVEEELAEAKARAELYLDLMGHDINNMNQSAQGFLELALQALEIDGKIRCDDKVLIEKPLQAVLGSSKLISNVRKLQQLADEGVKMRPVDIHDLLEELNSQDFQTGDREATINVHEVPHWIVEGSDLLRDVFFNLVSNAVKHSEPDRPVIVDIRVDRVIECGRAYCRCTVDDDGPGVPDELKPRLFQRFQRGKTRARGKGLGLYLVKSLVESYGGRVWVEDRVSGDHTKGARFVVMLPAVDS